MGGKWKGTSVETFFFFFKLPSLQYNTHTFVVDTIGVKTEKYTPLSSLVSLFPQCNRTN